MMAPNKNQKTIINMGTIQSLMYVPIELIITAFLRETRLRKVELLAQDHKIILSICGKAQDQTVLSPPPLHGHCCIQQAPK